ncbi:YceD family protein [Alsobacter sp. R-9]
MTASTPLSRPLVVDSIPAAGLDVSVEASPDERAALARDFGLVSIERLAARLHVDRRGRVVRVTGDVEADVTQTCVVSLEPFPAQVREAIDLRFRETEGIEDEAAGEGGEHEVKLDDPDPIVGGRIDLGEVTAEFVALGLDPYPRKPGVAFAWTGEGDGDPSPFAALARLKKDGDA